MNDKDMSAYIEAMSSLGATDELLPQIMAQIQALRGQQGGPGPEGRSGGGMYVAANPLEFAGDLANKYVTKQKLNTEEGRLAGEQAGQRMDRQLGMRQLIEALRSGGEPATPSAAPMRGYRVPERWSA